MRHHPHHNLDQKDGKDGHTCSTPTVLSTGAVRVPGPLGHAEACCIASRNRACRRRCTQERQDVLRKCNVVIACSIGFVSSSGWDIGKADKATG